MRETPSVVIFKKGQRMTLWKQLYNHVTLAFGYLKKDKKQSKKHVYEFKNLLFAALTFEIITRREFYEIKIVLEDTVTEGAQWFNNIASSIDRLTK